MKYPLSEKYSTPELMGKIMGPNPVKLEEELLTGHQIPAGGVVCDLGSGQGLTSVFLAKEYGFTVYAADLWSDPEENRRFFRKMGLSETEIVPVKADAAALPFEPETADIGDSDADPANIVTEMDESEHLENILLSGLSEFEKQVVNLRLQNNDYSQIASALNCSKKAVDNALQRIRKKMRKKLNK